MRELKFRAWDGVFMSDNNPTLTEIYNKENMRDIDRCKDWVWMQFTGLIDEDGLDCYEGDLLKDSDGNISCIVFENSAWRKAYKEGWEQGLEKPLLDQCDIEMLDLKVIGNRHQHPHLLEDES